MNRVNYKILNTKDYEHIPGLLWVQPQTICSLENTIQTSIDNFNNNVEWEDMWTLEQAYERLEKGHDLFLGVTEDGPMAHVWFENDYLYNAFVDPRRVKGYGVRFIQACLNFMEYDYIRLYCDDWNIRAQKFFEKVGFLKESN